MFNHIIIHYGEIGLKGKNQGDFLRQLKENIGNRLRVTGNELPVHIRHGYLLVEVTEQADTKKILDSLQQVFGIVWLAAALRLATADLEDIERAMVELARESFQGSPKGDMNFKNPPPARGGSGQKAMLSGNGKGGKKIEDPLAGGRNYEKSFCVKVNRADKNFPIKSPELARRLGQAIQENTDWQEVDLKEPDQTFYVSIEQGELFIYNEKILGPGGLPVGTAGRVLTLLSGGIDSPVAGYLMAKRGATVDFLHFTAVDTKSTKASSRNSTKVLRDDKLGRLVEILSQYTLQSKLYVVPYTYFNLAIVGQKTFYELILFRRFMARVAEQLAFRLNERSPRDAGTSPEIPRYSRNDKKIQAIVTGDNLSQVASQTLPNLVVTSRSINLPIFRPLLSFDKQEIIALAQKIGTYDISLEPYKDCCSIIEQHPKTRSEVNQLEVLEQELFPDYQKMIDDTLADMVTLEHD